jgi:anti-sigma factor RsiW
MCDLSGKLVAWMDGELGNNDAAEVERHIQNCGECRSRVEAYGEVSRLVVTYCEVQGAGAAPRKLPRWVPVLAGMAAAAAVLLFILRPAPVRQVPVVAQVANPAPALAVEATSAPTKV